VWWVIIFVPLIGIFWASERAGEQDA